MLMKAAWLWLLSKIKTAEQLCYVRERRLCKRVQRDVCKGNPFNPLLPVSLPAVPQQSNRMRPSQLQAAFGATAVDSVLWRQPSKIKRGACPAL